MEEKKTQTIQVLPDLQPYNRTRIQSLGIKGLHFGSGTNLHPDCLNTDVMQLSEPSGTKTEEGKLSWIGMKFYYLQHDATKPFPVEEGSFEWVYSEHFIEHIPQQMAVEWLREVRRVLKPGGFLRLSTPSLRRYAEGYLDMAMALFSKTTHSACKEWALPMSLCGPHGWSIRSSAIGDTSGYTMWMRYDS